MPPECTICLEPLAPDCRIGEVQTCGHYYHDHCVLEWTGHSNSCPTCRVLFHKIYIKAGGQVVATHRVQDKLLATEAINEIPQEFVIPASYVAPDQPEAPSGVCSICASADDRLSLTNTAACQTCASVFHLRCLGVSSQPTSWCCPMCDAHQVYVPLQRSRPSPRRRVVQEAAPRPARSPSGLVIHNENGEIDDSFLYDDRYDLPANYSPPPILNGGVLLRKELRQLENLTSEELKSWEVFDQVRKNNLSASDDKLHETASSTRRKRKKLSQVPVAAASAINTGTSRLSSLMSEIRQSNYQTPNQKLEAVASYESNLNSPTEGSPSSLSNFSPSSLSNFSPQSIDEDSENERKAYFELKTNPTGQDDTRTCLTFDQKNKIQTLIRDNLRPLYRPKAPTRAAVIKSEDDYVNINKSASRKIYSKVVDNAESAPGVPQQIIEEFLGNDDRLKSMVKEYVTKELDKYTGN